VKSIAAKRQGFEVVVHERSLDNKEKAVDTELVARGMEIIWSAPGAMDRIIVSGASAFNAAGEMATSVEKGNALGCHFRAYWSS
jgi:hypothetical protein